jgi:hypothetical protein
MASTKTAFTPAPVEPVSTRKRREHVEHRDGIDFFYDVDGELAGFGYTTEIFDDSNS